MINLLPPDYKQDIVYARRNTQLRKWVIASIIGVLGILIIIAAGHLFINRSIASTERQVITMREQLGAQKLEETQARVTEISDSVKLATQVLSQQVLFSNLLTQIGAAMPPGTALSSLSIGSLDGGIDLSAVAKDYQSATQVQINLENPDNKIFEKADIVSVTCQEDVKNTSAYKCQVSIRALFAKDNEFQFVNKPAGVNL